MPAAVEIVEGKAESQAGESVAAVGPDVMEDAGTAVSEPIEAVKGDTDPQSTELAATPAPDATTDAGSTTSEPIEAAESAEPVAVVEMNDAADTGAARPGTEPVVLQTTAAAR